MALWDAADLLARCQTYALRPEAEQATDAARTMWYRFLTEAQSEWVTHIASLAPESQYGPPTAMVTDDDGETYTFRDAEGALVFPMGHLAIRPGRTGPWLVPTSDASMVGDYTIEGDRIRIPNGQRRVFPDGLYARFVAPPGVLDADHAPTLKPPHARILLVFRALRKWAGRGGLRDPQAFLDMENEAWLGNPQAGVHGILGALKTQHGLAGYRGDPDPAAWWRGNPDLGRSWGR